MINRKILARGLFRVQVAHGAPPGPSPQTGVVPNEGDGASLVTKPCSRWTGPTPFPGTNQCDAQQVLDPGDSDSESFDDFFRKSKRQVVGMSYMLTGDSSSAQDIDPEAFLREWVRWPRVQKFDDTLG